MNRVKYLFCLAIVLAVGCIDLATAAQRDWQVRQTINNLDTDFARFRTSLNQALRNGNYDTSRNEDRIQQFADDFQQSFYQIRDRRDTRAVNSADVQTLLQQGADIDRFLGRHPMQGGVQRNWNAVRQDLDRLADAYNVRWDWNNPQYYSGRGNNPDNRGGNYPDNRGGNYPDNRGGYSRLTGTYQLDPSRSDNVTAVVDRSTRSLPAVQRRQVRDMLTARLNAPDMLAIERQGRNVTIASSKGNRVDFDADGVPHSEQVSSGRTVQMSATLSGDQLMINTVGNRETDFSATFEPIDNGRSLRVTRRVYSDRLNQPVVFQSVYNRTSDRARWDIYANTATNYPPDNGGYKDFVIPNGTQLTATLNTDLSTRTSRDGDSFTMTVRSPAEYNGAVIDGYVSNLNSSGSVSGRANMSFNFRNIRMRDGQTYRFNGFIDSVRTRNGELLQVSNEGTVRSDNSQGTKTAERTGVGAAVGAVIGAIAGGGKGAGIGAVIGGGAGAGSVLVQGKDQLDLYNGSEFRIAASAPDRR